MIEKETTKQPSRLQQDSPAKNTKDNAAKEIGGPKGPEPTRYGDWERKGRCVDF